jgi:S1-C subfamily serine protease
MTKLAYLAIILLCANSARVNDAHAFQSNNVEQRAPEIDTRGHGNSLDDVYARAAKSSVFIDVRTIDPNDGKSVRDYSASGFLIADSGFILTSYYALADWLKQGDADKAMTPIMVAFESRSNMPLEARYIEGDPASGIALLKLTTAGAAAYRAAPICFPVDMPHGSFVFGFGYPYGRELTSIPATYLNADGDQGRWRALASFPNGMLGGPVYDERGFVVGVINSSENSTDLAVITPLRWARPIIESRTAVQQSCFGTCRAPQNGVERWTNSTPWTDRTEWMGGGHNPTEECDKLRAIYMDKHSGQLLEITNTSEVNEKDVLGRVSYQYTCSGTIKSEPIYVLMSSPSCPPP